MTAKFGGILRAIQQSGIPIRFYAYDDLFWVNSNVALEDGEMHDTLIDDIIDGLDEGLIPWDYIDLAIVTGLDGLEREVKGDELLSLLSHPSIGKVALSVQVLIDRKRLKVDIAEAIDFFWQEVLGSGDDE